MPPQSDLSVSFDLENSAALAYLLTRPYEFAGETVDSLIRQLRDVWNSYLTQGIREGMTIAELTEQVQRAFKGTERAEWWRARRIARTEAIGSANMGTAAAYRQANVPFKTWVTSMDGRVRDNHRPMNNVSVPTTEKFRLPDGSLMESPGDPAGGPANVVHCRCDLYAAWAAPSPDNGRFSTFQQTE